MLRPDSRNRLDEVVVKARNFTGWATLGYFALCTEASFSSSIVNDTAELAMAACVLHGGHQLLRPED